MTDETYLFAMAVFQHNLSLWDCVKVWLGYRRLRREYPEGNSLFKDAIYLQKEGVVWREVGQHAMADVLQHAAEELMG